MDNYAEKYSKYLHPKLSDEPPKSENTSTNSNLEKIFASQKRIKVNSCKTVTFSTPIITYNDTGIIYPNTINIIQGKKGVHKSRLTEIFCGLMLSKVVCSTKKYLGMK